MSEDNKIFRINDIVIQNCDFLNSKLRNNSVDLVITSPPYNIGIDYGSYDDNKTYKEYLEFSRLWLAKCFNILRDGGRICINVPIDTGKTGKRSIAADLTILAKRTGFKYKGTIVWNKQNTKNKHAMVFSKNVEVILIFYREATSSAYKNGWKPVKYEFKNLVNEIWQFSGESEKRVGHPAPFPVEIPRRLIKMLTQKNEIVMDPFLGSGTTMVACELCGRKGIGVEIDERYFKIARERLVKRKW